MTDVYNYLVCIVHAYLYLFTHCLVVIHMYMCVMCVYYSNCIPIMSNICDRTDTSTCIYYFMVIYMRLSIVCVVV